MRLIALFVALCAALPQIGCSRQEAAYAVDATVGPPRLIAAASGPVAGRVTRIDGAVEQQVRVTLQGGVEYLAVLTGRVSGAEQSSLLLFDALGQRVAAAKLPRNSPYPALEDVRRDADDRLRQPPIPLPDRLDVVHAGGRQLIGLLIVGSYSPSAFLLYELDTDGSLISRLELWSYGHLESFAQSGSYLAVFGWDNTRQMRPGKYGRAVCVIDLEACVEAASEGRAVRGAMPQGRALDADVPPGFVGYFPLPLDHPTELNIDPVRWEDGRIVAQFYTGLAYQISAPDGAIATTATEEYRRGFRTRPLESCRSFDVDEHLAILSAEAAALQILD